MIPKYRAWDKTTNQMRGCYGFNELEREVYVCSVADDEFNGQLKTVHAIKRSFDEVILMQYTGLKDKNGVEIYLDDVLSDEYGRKYIAVFKGDCVRCDAIRPGGKNRWISNYLEVIGNIHENPELLEVKE